MALPSPSSTIIFLILAISAGVGVEGATFTFTNKCSYTVWPGILANAGSPRLESTGFELSPSASRTFQAPTGWSGRFWARTNCNFDATDSDFSSSSSEFSACSTGNCGSGEVECHDLGATPPVTLAEFTLGGAAGGMDFYDVSLVDGYNVPMFIEGNGGTGACGSTGCLADLNTQCPKELRTESGGACKSACMAFGSPEYCCSGAFSTPDTCQPSVYSEMFKSACPRSYSYAYDDATSTFTCSGADYTITFCPSSTSQKSLTDTTPSQVGTDSNANPIDGASEVSGATGSVPGTGGVVSDGSWLAGLAMGGSSSTKSSSVSPIHVMNIITFGSALLTFFSL